MTDAFSLHLSSLFKVETPFGKKENRIISDMEQSLWWSLCRWFVQPRLCVCVSVHPVELVAGQSCLNRKNRTPPRKVSWFRAPWAASEALSCRAPVVGSPWWTAMGSQAGFEAGIPAEAGAGQFCPQRALPGVRVFKFHLEVTSLYWWKMISNLIVLRWFKNLRIKLMIHLWHVQSRLELWAGFPLLSSIWRYHLCPTGVCLESK